METIEKPKIKIKANFIATKPKKTKQGSNYKLVKTSSQVERYAKKYARKTKLSKSKIYNHMVYCTKKNRQLNSDFNIKDENTRTKMVQARS